MANPSKALGKIFITILDEMKIAGEGIRKQIPNSLTFWHIFQDPVPTSKIKDYGFYVPKQDEMWLKRIKTKAMKGEYPDAASFLADVHKIRVNCAKYSDPITGGIYKSPVYIDYVIGMEDFIKTGLERKKHLIDTVFNPVGVEHWEYQPQVAAAAAAVVAPQPRAVAHTAAAHVSADIVEWDFGAPAAAAVATAPGPSFLVSRSGNAAPAAAAVVEEVPWVMCEKCRAWRIFSPPADPNAYWECTMKPGFTCGTPLEPGASYEQPQ